MAQSFDINVRYNETKGTTSADSNVQVDWEQTDVNKLDFIKNKPFLIVDDGLTVVSNAPTLQTTNGLLAVHDDVMAKIATSEGYIKYITWEDF